MKLSDIQQELMRLFEAQDASVGGVIVVWHDPDGAFAGRIEEIDLPGVEVFRETENKLFALKRALNGDLSGRCILLYRPRARRLEGDWLADIEARSTSFTADYTSMQVRELNAADTREMRETLQAHKQQLSKKTVLRKLAKLSDAYEQPQQLVCGLMAVALDAKSIQPDSLVQSFLIAALATDGTQAYTRLRDMGCAEEFSAALNAWIGYAGDPADFMALTRHLLLGALSHALPEQNAAFPTDVAAPHAAHCHSIVHNWAQGIDHDALFELSQLAEEAFHIEDALRDIPLGTLAAVDALPCIDALVLRRLFASVANEPETATHVLTIAAARHGMAWFREFADFYSGLESAADIQQYRHEHPQGIEALPAERLWNLYVAELHRIDAHYRHMHLALGRARRAPQYGLDEDFRACCAQLEQVYKNWFLAGLSTRWENAVEHDLTTDGRIADIPRQLDFFMREVEPVVHAGKRACVIISDALRFEVAAELGEMLERGTKGSCEVYAMQASFPSITSVGMGSLLPGSSLCMEETESGHLRVLVDGAEVATTAARQEQLRTFDAGAVAITYDKLVNQMGGAERKALVQDAKVVYIYHNAIDAAGDAAQTERKVFRACTETCEELFGLVQLICRERIASQAIITADHGFLYTDEPLAPADHAAAGDITGEAVILNRRYAIARAGAASDVLMPIALPHASGKLVGFAPRGCTRISRAGAGENYMHGGISLQELCVPVLKFVNKRAGSKGYVEAEQAALSLITTIDVISNSIFSLELLQDKPVGGKVLPTVYEMFVGTMNHQPVTDTARIVVDRTQENAAERVTSITLNLKPGVATSEQETYRLYVRNCDTGSIASLRDLRIRVAFAPSIDFGW